VLDNDTLNGIATSASEVTVTFIDASVDGITLDEITGEIHVAPGTPGGEHQLHYRICDRLNPTNCDQATVLISIDDGFLLRLDKQATPQEVRVGDLVRYTLTASNTSALDLTNLVLLDTPPAGFSFVDGSLQVSDRDGEARLNGINPIRIE